MRRIIAAIVATISALVLLFSYRTSTMGPELVASSDPADAAGTDEPGVVTPTAPGAPGSSTTATSPTSTPRGTSPTSPTSPTTSPANRSPNSTTTTTAPPATDGAGSTVVNGTRVTTRWGPVQVQVTLTDGKIVGVKALAAPDANARDRQLTARALPILEREALAAQSARIDAVSGATVTSQGYIQSLQAALDAANAGAK